MGVRLHYVHVLFFDTFDIVGFPILSLLEQSLLGPNGS
jgi:hypothetical protein